MDLNVIVVDARARAMGIKGLTQLLQDNAPGAMREQKFDSYLDRRVAVDASMHIYQFMIAGGTRGRASADERGGRGDVAPGGNDEPNGEDVGGGDKTDLCVRWETADDEGWGIGEAEGQERGSGGGAQGGARGGRQAEIEKLAKRTVRVSKEHSKEVMRLATLLGVPVYEAPCEAEASCAALCKAGLVWAVATEDMDTLTFAAPRMARNLMAPKSAEKPVLEFDYEKVLAGLGLTADEFIDLCIILCGCDYTDTIRGIGPKTALKLVKEHTKPSRTFSRRSILKSTSRRKIGTFKVRANCSKIQK